VLARLKFAPSMSMYKLEGELKRLVSVTRRKETSFIMEMKSMVVKIEIELCAHGRVGRFLLGFEDLRR
jgi:hypothetical protein